jgi:hypothetical protein
MNLLPTTKQSRMLIFAAGILLFGGLVVWLSHRAAQRLKPGQTPASLTSTGSRLPVGSSGATTTADAALNRLQEIFDRLKSGPDTKMAEQQLVALRKMLSAMPRNEAVAAIRRFLDSKADAPTHLGFKVGKGGLLDEAPTLRTFLLDELARLDLVAAADYAKIILASKDSPDEWAVALRNLAWGDTSTAGRQLLEQKTSELLQYAPWQQSPSVGYLQAFDTAVYLGGTDLLPPLTGLVRKQDNPAVAHAAFLALDRLAFSEPANVLAALEAHPDWMQGREETRADYFARADVGDPAQRAIVESYLLDPVRTPEELQAFAGVFPNANFMISQNLLTENTTLNGASLRQRDQVSLQVVNQWLADPKFEKLRQPLEQIKTRLQQFVNQEK